jgi:hypothetical protein
MIYTLNILATLTLHMHNLWQNLLYLYNFVYNLSDEDLVQTETRRRDVSDKWLFVIDCEICWIKNCINQPLIVILHF